MKQVQFDNCLEEFVKFEFVISDLDFMIWNPRKISTVFLAEAKPPALIKSCVFSIEQKTRNCNELGHIEQLSL